MHTRAHLHTRIHKHLLLRITYIHKLKYLKDHIHNFHICVPFSYTVAVKTYPLTHTCLWTHIHSFITDTTFKRIKRKLKKNWIICSKLFRIFRESVKCVHVYKNVFIWNTEEKERKCQVYQYIRYILRNMS